jgi:hypothetical protein
MSVEIYIILALIAALIIQQIMHLIERKDLFTRFMAKDLTEYEQVSKKFRKAEANNMRKKVKEYQQKWR